MKRLHAIIGLELYAILLVVVQWANGVRTDEAKYLLNIPYPHPPLVRWILGATDGLPLHEIFWRIVFATIVVQAVWLIADMVRMAHQRGGQMITAVLCGLWLLSAPIAAQGGTVMMAPLTALQGLVFLWLLRKQEGWEVQNIFVLEGWTAMLSVCWLACLFTAYQILLFLPIVALLFWRLRIPTWEKVVGFGGPIALLFLYTLTNPLIPASMLAIGSQNNGVSFFGSLLNVVRLWAIGGSIVLSAWGTVAIVRSRSWELILSMALIAFYAFLSFRPYYAILFTPIFVGGFLLSHKPIRSISAILTVTGIITVIFLTTSVFPLKTTPGIARQTIRSLQARCTQDPSVCAWQPGAPLLINGSFGHDWQYESPWPIRRYRENLRTGAVGVVRL